MTEAGRVLTRRNASRLLMCRTTGGTWSYDKRHDSWSISVALRAARVGHPSRWLDDAFPLKNLPNLILCWLEMSAARNATVCEPIHGNGISGGLLCRL